MRQGDDFVIFREEKRDLFAVPEDYYLAHCVSADFALGAGIAVEFNKRFDMRRKLKEDWPNCIEEMRKHGLRGECCLIENVFNLITKERCYYKPTYTSIEEALHAMRIVADINGVKKIAMPKIGCGLDGKDWSVIKKMLKDIFEDSDIEILVCSLE